MAITVQHEVEIILIRRWASYISLPILLVAPDGAVLYYNDAAGALLGRTFDESGPMTATELAEVFKTSDEAGQPMPASTLPVVRALEGRRPSHGRLRYVGLDGRSRTVDVTALPLIGQNERYVGVLVAFWEPEPA